MTSSGDPRTSETMHDTDHDHRDAASSDAGASDAGASDAGPSEDTVEVTTPPSLADDLLHGGAADGDAEVVTADPAADPGVADPDDDDYLEPDTRRRSRVTTTLLVALIFALGTLTGVLVGRVLTPAPAPRIIYLLNDAPSSAPSASALPAPTPSVSR